MKKKLFVPALLAMTFAGGTLLAGCGSSTTGTTETNKPAESTKAAATSSGKPVKIDIIETGSGLPTPDQDIIKQELDKALNTEINLTVYASGDDYKNQLNVRMASANFPDLFAVDRQQLKQFSEQGLLLDLTPYMDKLKPTKDFIGDASLKKGALNGKTYAIAKSPTVPYNTYWIRKDWLDKLNLKVPTTPEELYNVAKAFTEQDPDGNGKKDTFGLTGSKFGAFEPVFGAYGIAYSGVPSLYVKDNKMVNSLYDPNMKDALGFIQKMVASGEVDPELMANTGTQHQQKAIKGQAGIVYLDWPNVTKDQFVEQIKAVNPNANWIQVEAMKGVGGQFVSGNDIGATAGMYAIPKSLEKSPEKLQKVLDLLNYVSGKDGSPLVQYGVKGKHYNLDGTKVVPTDLMGKEGGYFWLYQFTGRPEMDYLTVKFAPQSKFIEFASKQPRIEVLNGFVDFPNGYNAADANRYIEEELSKFIYGKRPLSEYDSFIKTLEGSMNYKAYLDAAEKRIKELGYIK
ncbi:extracellular solute-binding protein [Paenibacillus qinlingensis]|uniref:Aldouronate transport system substrate-binding protein n=1 Tax=Paenibacillus qinlingensis TaxID=1837343 RepID=A0ABU1NXY5_9BACL|nr:extracellular solute-binding protein [Paenibacillus qinlingensis]MDR6551931.1 putative aldouronate transport system substrate-binding protein [Paenibacillus qinlingensis]